MRIVHVLKHGARGNGNVHLVVDLACAQADAGHEVYFASARCDFAELLRSHGVTVVPLTESSSIRTGVRAAIEIDRLVRRMRPEIVHAHMMSSAIAGLLVTRLRRTTLVTTVHNSFDGHSWIMRSGTRVVAVSEAERSLLLERGFPARKVMTVLNATGGSARLELPADEIGPLHRPAIMTLSGLHARKGVDDVIRAFALVTAEFPQWHLDIVGEGPDELLLKQQVAAAGLEGSVHFLGSTLTPANLLADAEIVATGTLADPCPLSIIEARLSGCAVVATAVGGIPELLDGGRAGHLVPPRSPEAMAAAFRGLLAEPERLAQWRRRAREGTGRFSVQRMRVDYDRVYLSVPRVRRLAGSAPA